MRRTLDEFAAHFAEWWNNWGPDDYFGMLVFCFYEGQGGSTCCGDILSRVAPYAVGHELVRHYNFQFAAIEGSASKAHIGVTHARVDFLDLLSLEDKRLIRADLRRPGEVGYSPGEATQESFRGILELAGESPLRSR